MRPDLVGTLAVLTAGGAAWLAVPSASPVRRLRRAGLPGFRKPPEPLRAGPAVAARVGRPQLRLLAAFLAAAGAALVIGGLLGVVLGAAAFALLRRWFSTLETRADRDRRRRLAADLPVAVELLAAALAAGSTLENATAAAADAVGGPLGEVLRSAAGALLLGAGPEEALEELGRDPQLAPLSRALRRAADSGAPLAAAMAALAEDQRRRRRATADEAARRLGVRAVAPLGLCFLPAFVLVGVLPVIAGLAAQLGQAVP